VFLPGCSTLIKKKYITVREETVSCYNTAVFFFYLFFKFFFTVLGFELKARQMLYHLSYTPNPFGFVIFQIGSNIFAWGWSQTMILLPTPPAQLGLAQVRDTDFGAYPKPHSSGKRCGRKHRLQPRHISALLVPLMPALKLTGKKKGALHNTA
jgi:hypothetical protein